MADTQSNWHNLPDGPELDALIAERVLGRESRQAAYAWQDELVWRDHNDCWGYLPRISTTWEGAGLVVEAMERRGYWLCYASPKALPHSAGLGFRVLHKAEFSPHGRSPQTGLFRQRADTAPLAICRAALAALETEEGS